MGATFGCVRGCRSWTPGISSQPEGRRSVKSTE
jgi:hypothetical protein